MNHWKSLLSTFVLLYAAQGNIAGQTVSPKASELPPLHLAAPLRGIEIRVKEINQEENEVLNVLGAHIWRYTIELPKGKDSFKIYCLIRSGGQERSFGSSVLGERDKPVKFEGYLGICPVNPETDWGFADRIVITQPWSRQTLDNPFKNFNARSWSGGKDTLTLEDGAILLVAAKNGIHAPATKEELASPDNAFLVLRVEPVKK